MIKDFLHIRSNIEEHWNVIPLTAFVCYMGWITDNPYIAEWTHQMIRYGIETFGESGPYGSLEGRWIGDRVEI